MDIRTEISGSACIVMALLCLALPMDWLLASGLSAVIHELCHMWAVMVSGGNVERIKIGPWGAVIDADCSGIWRTLFSILAGPAGSISLLALSPVMPKTAFCGLVQGLFNLLPVFPLDGGRAAACLCSHFFTQKAAKRLCFTLEILTMALVFVLGFGMTAAGMGLYPVLLSTILLVKVLYGNISCKEGCIGVQ